MRYLVSTLRIFVLVAVVLSIASFSDFNKAQAAGGCNASACNITETGTVKMVGNKMFFSGPSNFEIKTNIPTIISGNIIVTTYGALTFLNLTITNGAKLTQETIAISDIDSAGKLKPTGQDKKVDLNVTDKLELTNRGRIDVSAKGFPGGTNSHTAGYGPGGGIAGNNLQLSGGAYGGAACVYRNARCVAAYAGDSLNGSGGGRNTSRNRNGASGGGIIKIVAANMYFEQNDQVFLSANGGSIGGNDVISGGGAGGSILLNVTNTLTTSTPSFGSLKVDGYNNDQSLFEAFGKNGTIDNPGNFNGNIVANGAKLGGAGGRIKINLAKLPTIESCHITNGEIIPASCENQDVTVSGAGTVIEMNKVTLKTGSSCNNKDDVDCDSKRKFKSLTVKNGAVITHEALNYEDMKENITGNKSSLADDLLGKARWKKVDIEVTGAITFKTGGKIDVTGKGYPGAYFSWDGSGVLNSTIPGCTGDNLGYLVGALGIQDKNDTLQNSNYGFGPGGGIAYNQYDRTTGGGGSFAGSGKEGTYQTNPAKTYDPLIGIRLDWGSGGGAASHRGKNKQGAWDTSCANGGGGGGIVDLKADRLDMASSGSPEYVIIADGEIGNMFQDDRNLVGSGGGSGGVIRLKVNQITNNSGGYIINYSGGTNDATNGIVQGTYSSLPNRISVRGGNRSEHNLPATGAGGGGGYIILGPASVPVKSIKSKKIEAIVTWKEGTSDKTVKLYDILRSVVTN